jgi:hypothetical protein
MSEDIRDLERDIEETRARLDLTIDRLQDKLSVSGVVDDLIGAARARGFDSTFEQALTLVKNNPVPVMLVAAGIGWLLHRAGRVPAPPRRYERSAAMTAAAEESVPVINTGRARIYDPDADPVHPNRDAVEPGTDFVARA